MDERVKNVVGRRSTVDHMTVDPPDATDHYLDVALRAAGFVIDDVDRQALRAAHERRVLLLDALMRFDVRDIALEADLDPSRAPTPA